eukprot:GCRY01002146.1.p1 GENE.GCRY01002146.1~~GCRY01002146.1.p1  ORF type:complete len:866 (+),score=266.59 GCRY01002146.1:318-2915(+)
MSTENIEPTQNGASSDRRIRSSTLSTKPSVKKSFSPSSFECGRQRSETDAAGQFSVSKFHTLLLKDAEETKTDQEKLNEIASLKSSLTLEIKKAHELEVFRDQLDKKIALLIRNRINLQDVVLMSENIKKVKCKRTANLHSLPSNFYQTYGNLFYLLQTQPKYLADLAFLVKPSEFELFLQTIIFTIYGDQMSAREEFLLLSVFRLILVQEFKVTSQINTVLRGNSSTSRLIVAYTKRQAGVEYLKNTLEEPLNQILQNPDLDFEINPSKAYKALVTKAEKEGKTPEAAGLKTTLSEEEMNAHPEVRQRIDKNTVDFKAHSLMMVRHLFKSYNQIPYGIRWLCKQIKALTLSKFPDASAKEQNSLIGGYLFLRFLNPNILAPDGLSLVQGKISPTGRRNLVLLSKVIQNVSNQVPFGKKESFMEEFNSVVDELGSELNEFLGKIIQVPELEEFLQVNKYHDLTLEKNPLINISLRELKFMHELIATNLDVLAPGASDPLRVVMGTLPRLSALPDENFDIRLSLVNKWKLDMKSVSVDAPDLLYTDVKRAVQDMLLNLSPEEVPSHITLFQLLKNIAEKYPKKSEELFMIRKNLDMLRRQGLLPRTEDNFAALFKELTMDLSNHAMVRMRAIKQRDSLSLFVRNLRRRQIELQDQIDAYIQYLENVRAQQHSLVSPSAKAKKKKKKGGASGPSTTSSSAANGGGGGGSSSGGRESAEWSEDGYSSTSSIASVKEARVLGMHSMALAQLVKRGVVRQIPLSKAAVKEAHVEINGKTFDIFTVAIFVEGSPYGILDVSFDYLLEQQSNNNKTIELDMVTEPEFDLESLSVSESGKKNPSSKGHSAGKVVLSVPQLIDLYNSLSLEESA